MWFRNVSCLGGVRFIMPRKLRQCGNSATIIIFLNSSYMKNNCIRFQCIATPKLVLIIVSIHVGSCAFIHQNHCISNSDKPKIAMPNDLNHDVLLMLSSHAVSSAKEQNICTSIRLVCVFTIQLSASNMSYEKLWLV